METVSAYADETFRFGEIHSRRQNTAKRRDHILSCKKALLRRASAYADVTPCFERWTEEREY
jgi:hypothetical protein